MKKKLLSLLLAFTAFATFLPSNLSAMRRRHRGCKKRHHCYQQPICRGRGHHRGRHHEGPGRRRAFSVTRQRPEHREETQVRPGIRHHHRGGHHRRRAFSVARQRPGHREETQVRPHQRKRAFSVTRQRPEREKRTQEHGIRRHRERSASTIRQRPQHRRRSFSVTKQRPKHGGSERTGSEYRRRIKKRPFSFIKQSRAAKENANQIIDGLDTLIRRLRNNTIGKRDITTLQKIISKTKEKTNRYADLAVIHYLLFNELIKHSNEEKSGYHLKIAQNYKIHTLDKALSAKFKATLNAIQKYLTRKTSQSRRRLPIFREPSDDDSDNSDSDDDSSEASLELEYSE